MFTAAAEDAADKPQSLKKFIIEEIFILPDYYKQLLFIFHSENTTDYMSNPHVPRSLKGRMPGLQQVRMRVGFSRF